MNFRNPDTLDKIRQQYDRLPYPHKPLDTHPKDDDPTLDLAFIHSFTTPYYLRNQCLPDLTNRVILDAGCGSGYNALRLAHANPSTKIVGIDLSLSSARLAEQRLHYHGYSSAECHALLLEDLPSLGLKFDYINCDEVLYLLPDPIAGLNAMMSVLNPDGIIRANLHSSLQRGVYYRAQSLFQMMGLMDNNPGEIEIEIVRETMQSLKRDVDLRKYGWHENFIRSDENQHKILMNYLLQGDRGFTIPEMFEMFRATHAEFISMTVWRDWEVISLFENPDDLPINWALALPELSDEERLRLYELMNPVHRLLDFWCGHPRQTHPFKPIATWEDHDWQHAVVHLHPLLKIRSVHNDAIAAVKSHKAFDFSQYISLPTMAPIMIESYDLAFLLPLWDHPQPLMELVKHYLQLYPIDPVTLTHIDKQTAFAYVTNMVSKLETFLYCLVEQK